MSFDRIGRLIDAETLGGSRYSALAFFRDLRSNIWTEASSGKAPDLYRRNLQRTYLDLMLYLMTNEGPSRSFSRPGFEGGLVYNVSTSDVRALVRGELSSLQSRLKTALRTAPNTITRYHYQDALARIEQVLEGELND